MAVMPVTVAHGIAALAVGAIVASCPACDVTHPVPTTDVSADARRDLADLWDAALASLVDERGQVAYHRVKANPAMAAFLQRLATTDPATLPDANARKAFWINAYNALAIHGVVSSWPDDDGGRQKFSVIRMPVDGLPPNKGFFVGLKFVVGGRSLSLDEIEQRLLLRRWDDAPAAARAYYRQVAVDVPDPRIHFALVCCAVGCPRLQPWAYRAEKIDPQLDEVAAAFFNDPQRSRFEPGERRWFVSELLNWYATDFTATSAFPRADRLIDFAARYVKNDRVKRALQYGQWRTEFLPYDWTLNWRRSD